jgi:hypothetical protein
MHALAKSDGPATEIDAPSASGQVIRERTQTLEDLRGERMPSTTQFGTHATSKWSYSTLQEYIIAERTIAMPSPLPNDSSRAERWLHRIVSWDTMRESRLFHAVSRTHNFP